MRASSTLPEPVRVVLDTNVWISGIFFERGTPARLLREWRDHRFVVVLTAATRDELATVLARKTMQFRAPAALASQWIEYVEAYGTLVHAPATRVTGLSRDPKDDIILEAAVAGQVEFLVTGDDDLLVLERVMNTRIITPRTFLDWLEAKTDS